MNSWRKATSSFMRCSNRNSRMCQHGLAVAADMKTIQSLRRTCFRPIIRGGLHHSRFRQVSQLRPLKPQFPAVNLLVVLPDQGGPS